MFVYVVAFIAIVVSAAGLMLWPTHLSPTIAMYRQGDVGWADREGYTGPRMGLVLGGAGAVIGLMVTLYVLAFVTFNPLAIASILVIFAGSPVIGAAVWIRRSLTIPVNVWFPDGTNAGARIESTRPLREWNDQSAEYFVPVNGVETVWLYAAPAEVGGSVDPQTLVDTEKWSELPPADFNKTAGQDSSKFYARCDTSPVQRWNHINSRRSRTAETVKGAIILGMMVALILAGWLAMSAS